MEASADTKDEAETVSSGLMLALKPIALRTAKT